MNTLGLIHLTPPQSVLIYGWWSPKRTLTWKEVCSTAHITVKLLCDVGITPRELMVIQPDIHEWIVFKNVTFTDVPFMTVFPLHPFKHLHGNIASLVEFRYTVDTLVELDITYLELRAVHMDDNWMKAMDLSLSEWNRLGMKVRDLQESTCLTVFGKTMHKLI
jgi:hypothetical protein